jgi:amino acid transporter
MNAPQHPSGGLQRDLGPWQATALNVANMVGIGPFVTIPLFIASMGGPHAMIAWVIAAVLVICDGMIWSELGAAMPGSGGSYHFLRTACAGSVFGRLLPFLFIWQFLFSGTLELASGCIGMMNYVKYALPGLEPAMSWVPGGHGLSLVAALCMIAVTLLLCRRTAGVGKLGLVLCIGTAATVLIVILCGVTHFSAEKLAAPAGAWHISGTWVQGLGAAMAIAVYDYLGYYNICHLGDEVKNPARTIPRAVLWSIVIVASAYLVMNISIISVVPWREAMQSENIAALFMERLFGPGVARAFTWLVVWTAFACLFAIIAGYSRIPFAAARGGDFFPVFGRLHGRHAYPWVSLLVIGGLGAVFCFYPLDMVISAAVAVRIAVQFICQIFALHHVRKRRPDIHLPFRMWLYPVPSCVAFIGWCFILATTNVKVLLASLGVLASGVVVFVIWQNFFKTGPDRPSA